MISLFISLSYISWQIKGGKDQQKEKKNVLTPHRGVSVSLLTCPPQCKESLQTSSLIIGAIPPLAAAAEEKSPVPFHHRQRRTDPCESKHPSDVAAVDAVRSVSPFQLREPITDTWRQDLFEVYLTKREGLAWPGLQCTAVTGPGRGMMCLRECLWVHVLISVRPCRHVWVWTHKHKSFSLSFVQLIL